MLGALKESIKEVWEEDKTNHRSKSIYGDGLSYLTFHERR